MEVAEPTFLGNTLLAFRGEQQCVWRASPAPRPDIGRAGTVITSLNVLCSRGGTNDEFQTSWSAASEKKGGGSITEPKAATVLGKGSDGTISISLFTGQHSLGCRGSAKREHWGVFGRMSSAGSLARPRSGVEEHTSRRLMFTDLMITASDPAHISSLLIASSAACLAFN